MFLSSVFVPSTSEPTGRTLTLASARIDPSSMLQSLTPRWRSAARIWRRNSAAARRGAEVGLGHDLHQRRAAPVEVDDGGLGPGAAAAVTDVDELGGVLLEVGAGDAGSR